MAAASSSSSDSMPPWVLLNRVAHVWDGAEQEHPEAALKLSWSPTISTLSVARSVHPDRENYDRHAYVVAYDAGGLLLHIAISPSIGLDFRPNPAGLFVVVPVRGFVPAMADKLVMSADAAIRVPERVNMTAVASIKSLGLLFRHGTCGIEYLVAELVEDADDSANLLRFRSGSDAWVEEKLRCISFNPRCTDEVLSHDGRLWWVDLGMGLVSCNPFQDHPILVYQDLPNGVARRDMEGPEWAWKDIEKRRCLTVSSGMLRFLELKGAETNADTGEMMVTMWTFVSDPEDGSTSWIREFKMEFSKILQDYSYKKSHLPLQMPVLAIFHPDKAELIYFFIDGRLFSVDVTAHRLLEVITNLSPFNLVEAWNGAFAPPPLSWRYLIAWELSDSQQNHCSRTLSENEGELIPHSSSSTYEASTSADRRQRRTLARLCRQGVKAAQIFASDLGVGASSMGSNLLYLNEEFVDAKLFFQHVGEFKSSGHGYAAQTTAKSAKASKVISKLLGGAASALSYGGTACNSVGFTLQKLHPKAQTGGSARNAITEVVTVESVQQAEDVIREWLDSKDPVTVDVPCHMETDVAVEIMQLFKEAGALVLVENSHTLREKAAAVLDTDWHIV